MSFSSSHFQKQRLFDSETFKTDIDFNKGVNFRKPENTTSNFERLAFKDVKLAEKFNFVCQEPKIAILLSAYEGESYLADQLDSILNQRYSNWKIYACDDCSTDNTLFNPARV